MQTSEVRPRYVMDASVAMKWHLHDEQDRAHALALLTDYREGHVELLAPDHICYELANAIRTAVRANRLSETDGPIAIEDFFSWRIPTVGGQSLVMRGYQEAMRYGCAFYDGLYVALADAAGCPLVHADRRLRNTLGGRFPRELWIDAYPAS